MWMLGAGRETVTKPVSISEGRFLEVRGLPLELGRGSAYEKQQRNQKQTKVFDGAEEQCLIRLCGVEV